MSRTLVLATILCMVFGGVALADRDHRKGGKSRGGPVVRDHRGPVGGPVVRDHRAPRHKDHRKGHKGHKGPKHVRVANGRYVFPGGVVRVYKKPKIRHRYYDRRVRPAVIVEHYDPVPGYVWVSGGWSWSGAEWIWMPGYYAVDATASATFSVGASVTIR